MAEEVNQSEAYTSLVADVFDLSFPSERMARTIHSTTWRKHYDPEGSQSWEEYLEGPEKGQELANAVNTALDNLSSREAKVLKLRFGLDDGKSRTLDEVGNELGVTRERIRQMGAKALRRLRHPYRAKFIISLLPEKA